MFAGYDRFLGNQLVDVYNLVPGPVRRSILAPLIKRLPDNFSYNNRVAKLRWLAAMSESSAGERYAMSASFLRFSHEHKRTLYSDALWRELGGLDSTEELVRHFNADNADHPIDRMLHTDVKTRLADHLLMVVDRMTMAHSLEARSPFVDQRVAEFAASVPAGLKLHGRQLKYIQRRLAAEYLPAPLLRRSKQGFGFPLAYWFANELRETTAETLLNSNLVEAGYFRREAIGAMFDEHVGGRVDHNYRLWLLLNLELWHRLFIGGEPEGELTAKLRERIGQPSSASGEQAGPLGKPVPVGPADGDAGRG
jgi:asparagine synthase (glutamine-hydrolysing)